MTTAKAKGRRINIGTRTPYWFGGFEGQGTQILADFIVDYCNAAMIDDSSDRKRAPARSLMSSIEKRDYGADMCLTEDYMDWPKQIETSQQAIEELERDMTKFTAALKWLCSPKDPKPALPIKTLKALLESGQADRGRYPDIDQVSENFVKYFEDHALTDFQKQLSLNGGTLAVVARPRHLVDLFCVFLLDECRNKLPAEMPIKICRKCGKFFSVAELEGKARSRKQFCSAKCQSAAWWPPEKRRDDAFTKRLASFANKCRTGVRGFSIADLGRRLEKGKQRLDRIEERWKADWPEIVERVRMIRAQAAARPNRPVQRPDRNAGPRVVLNMC